MSKILERLAKLQSRVEESGDSFKVVVYDDELDTDAPVMWLTAEKIEVDGQEMIEVYQVNFDDKYFFSLPESRQDKCALVLFKKFIEYYEENYGKYSSEWLPVAADFANYKLQEKFKLAVEKGIFPPESLELTEFTDEDKWNNNSKYNMENRKKIYEIKENIAEYFPSLNIQNGYIVNNTISEIQNAVEELIAKYPFVEDRRDELEAIHGSIVNGDVYCIVPFGDRNKISELSGATFVCFKSNLISFKVDDEVVIQNISGNIENVEYVFGDVLDYKVNLMKETTTMRELLEKVKESSLQKASFRRLKRKIY